MFPINCKYICQVPGFENTSYAFSLKRLSSRYHGPVIRVRRVINDDEIDVYHHRRSDKLHILRHGKGQTLNDWLGTSSGSVVKWYNQSGDIHLIQSNILYQPIIDIEQSILLYGSMYLDLDNNDLNNDFVSIVFEYNPLNVNVFGIDVNDLHDIFEVSPITRQCVTVTPNKLGILSIDSQKSIRLDRSIQNLSTSINCGYGLSHIYYFISENDEFSIHVPQSVSEKTAYDVNLQTSNRIVMRSSEYVFDLSNDVIINDDGLNVNQVRTNSIIVDNSIINSNQIILTCDNGVNISDIHTNSIFFSNISGSNINVESTHTERLVVDIIQSSDVIHIDATNCSFDKNITVNGSATFDLCHFNNETFFNAVAQMHANVNIYGNLYTNNIIFDDLTLSGTGNITIYNSCILHQLLTGTTIQCIELTTETGNFDNIQVSNAIQCHSIDCIQSIFDNVVSRTIECSGNIKSDGGIHTNFVYTHGPVISDGDIKSMSMSTSVMNADTGAFNSLDVTGNFMTSHLTSYSILSHGPVISHGDIQCLTMQTTSLSVDNDIKTGSVLSHGEVKCISMETDDIHVNIGDLNIDTNVLTYFSNAIMDNQSIDLKRMVLMMADIIVSRGY